MAKDYFRFFFLFVVFLSCSAGLVFAADVKVTGRVVSSNLSPLEKVKVLFSPIEPISATLSMKEVRTGPDGWYEVSLPKGTYDVELDEWVGPINPNETHSRCLNPCEGYINVVRRARIDFSSFSSFRMDMFVPIEGFSDIGKNRREVNYEKYEDGAGTTLIIRYFRREASTTNQISYLPDSVGYPSQTPDNMLTYNTFTILADYITVDARQKRLTLSGRVKIYTGIAELTANRIMISLQSNIPSISFEN